MPSWKPDCLKASLKLTHLGNTLNTVRQFSELDQTENNSLNYCNQSNENQPNSYGYSKPLSFKNASSKLIIQKGYSKVELNRITGSQFGLTIAGGTDKDTRPRICDLKPGSIAFKSDELQIGDIILSINGFKTLGLKHEEIIDLIKNARERLILEYEYNLPPWPIHPHHAVKSKTVFVELEKDLYSYGFTMRGGWNLDKSKSRPLIVTNIRADGPADKEGTMKIGDRILAINGANLANATLQEAYMIIRQSKGSTVFLIEYDSAIVDSIKNSNGPLLIEIEKSPGSSIGLKLSSNSNQIFVESVKPASIADRCGAIYAGDLILSIDDVSFENITLSEANRILNNCVGEFSRIEIIPFSHVYNVNTTETINVSNREYEPFETTNSGRLNSNLDNNFTYISHKETVELELDADFRGKFGFTMQEKYSKDSINQKYYNLIIDYIEPNGPAEKSGIIQTGDRIICINGQLLDNFSLVEAQKLIKNTGNILKLIIEYDVADPNDFKKNYPIIDSIKKGSVAYRSGMIFPGDKIISVEDVCCKEKNLEELNLLLNSQKDIITLKVEKSNDFEISHTDFIQNINIKRNGGPLGITISESEDIREPVFVSGIVKGGLAENTQAIFQGDKILAINNISLAGKTLKEAIELLQNGCDTVTLKISRKNRNLIDNNLNFERNSYDLNKISNGQFIDHYMNELNSNDLKSSLKLNKKIIKRSSSLDSINAVEKELDDVLKDLELNSKELEFNDKPDDYKLYKHNSELFMNNFECRLGDDAILNQFNKSNIETNYGNNGHKCEKQKEYIENELDKLLASKTIKQRNNIISTYEICNQCYKSNNACDDSPKNIPFKPHEDTQKETEKLDQKNNTITSLKQHSEPKNNVTHKLPPVPPSSSNQNHMYKSKFQSKTNSNKKIRKTFSEEKIERNGLKNENNQPIVKINKDNYNDKNLKFSEIKETNNLKISEGDNKSNYNHFDNFIDVYVMKDHCYKDFGFYIGENKNLNCLYISKIRENGPADGIMEFQPFKKILKINGKAVNNVGLDEGNKILFNEYCGNNSGITVSISKDVIDIINNRPTEL